MTENRQVRFRHSYVWVSAILLVGLLYPSLDTGFDTNSLAVAVARAWLNPTTGICSAPGQSNDELPRTVGQSYLMGRSLQLCDRADAAERSYSAAKLGGSRRRVTAFLLANLYEREGKMDLAIQNWREAGASTSMAATYRHRATNAFAARNYDSGEQMALVAAHLEPQSPLPYWLLAAAYRDFDRDKMLAALSAGLERDRSSAWSYTARGLVAEYGTVLNLDIALACYQGAVMLDPEDAYAIRRLHDVVRKIGAAQMRSPASCPE